MKKTILILMIFLVSTAYAEVDKQYQIELFYDGNLSAGMVKVISAKETVYQNDLGDYRIELISFNKTILEKNKFDLSLIKEIRTYDLNGTEEYDIQDLNQMKKVLFLSYHKNAEKINVYKNQTLKLSLNVGKFSKEVPTKTKKQLVTENKIKETQELKEVEDEVKKTSVWKWVLVGFGLLVVIFVIGILLGLRRRSIGNQSLFK